MTAVPDLVLLLAASASPTDPVTLAEQLTKLSAYGLMILFVILLFTGRFIVLAREKTAVETQLADAKAESEQWKQAALDALGVAGGVVEGKRR